MQWFAQHVVDALQKASFFLSFLELRRNKCHPHETASWHSKRFFLYPTAKNSTRTFHQTKNSLNTSVAHTLTAFNALNHSFAPSMNPSLTNVQFGGLPTKIVCFNLYNQNNSSVLKHNARVVSSSSEYFLMLMLGALPEGFSILIDYHCSQLDSSGDAIIFRAI